MLTLKWQNLAPRDRRPRTLHSAAAAFLNLVFDEEYLILINIFVVLIVFYEYISRINSIYILNLYLFINIFYSI